jgi:hypothetical protein
MNIMCVKHNKAIFYFFLSISGLKNTQFYKDENFIPQNPKRKKRKIKIYGFVQPSISSCCVPTQHANILLHKSLMS